jgi:hypothetical protein
MTVAERVAGLNLGWAYAASRGPDVGRLAEYGFDGSTEDRELVEDLANLLVGELDLRFNEVV